MAITRTQIARQLYQAGGGADFGAPDKAKERASKSYGNPSGGKAASKGFKQDAPPGGQGPEVYGDSGPYNPDQALAAAIAQGKFEKKNPIENLIDTYTGSTKKRLYNIFPNNPENELDYLRSLPASQRALLSPGLRAKLEALELDEDQDLLDTAKTKFTFDEFEELTKFQPTEGLNFAEYAAKFKGAPGLLYSGDVGNLITIKNPDGTYRYERRTDDRGQNQPIIPIDTTFNMGSGDTDQGTDTTEEEPFMLARAFRADGGIMGGLADGQIDEMGRQMYGLGKLVKKVTRAVKKVAKSPIGKAALLYAGGTYLGGLKAFGGAGLGSGTFLSNLKSGQGIANLGGFLKGKLFDSSTTLPGTDNKGLLSKIFSSPTALITGASVVAGALTPDEENQAQQIADSTGFSIEEARNQILAARQDDFRARAFKAGGGLMRLGYQEGGDAEPVAKKTMPLLDMDGKEKDYRETGGFVDMGRMERADDVPARLSKNEFVFTADAVRNAGDGSVDKGAEVMYNMMKNLEAGGEVSEESQGLEGARKMFQTSQRLEEVI